MTYNQVQYKNARETERHNKMMEDETKRHQLAQELLQKQANQLQSQANSINQAHYERMDEINRLGLYETSRANQAREAENIRSNVANEYIRTRSNAIEAARLSETSRHQKAMEQIERSLNSSLIEKNLAEVSQTSANTGYIQAMTRTEGFRPNLLLNQIEEGHARTGLLSQQTQTEYTKRWSNIMSGFNQGASAVNQLAGVIKTIVPVISGAGKQPDFWTQMDSLLHAR